MDNITFSVIRKFYINFHYFYRYKISLTFQEMLLLNNQPDITIGKGFRSCLDYVFIGKNLYAPFSNDIRTDAKVLTQMSSLIV